MHFPLLPMLLLKWDSVGSLAAHGTELLSALAGHLVLEFPSRKWDGERRRDLVLPIPADEWGQAFFGLQVNSPGQMLRPSPGAASS